MEQALCKDMNLGPLFEAGYQAYEIVREAAKLEIEIMTDQINDGEEDELSPYYEKELQLLKAIVEHYSQDYYVTAWDRE